MTDCMSLRLAGMLDDYARPKMRRLNEQINTMEELVFDRAERHWNDGRLDVRTAECA